MTTDDDDLPHASNANPDNQRDGTESSERISKLLEKARAKALQEQTLREQALQAINTTREYAVTEVLFQYGRFIALAGLMFVALSGLCIFAVIVKTVLSLSESANVPNDGHAAVLRIVYDSAPNLILIITGFIAAVIGRALLYAGQRSKSSLPVDDVAILRQAIIEGRSDPVDQYIRLRALSGFTGGFTKIGLTGLPLVTISVTMIFTILALIFSSDDKIFTSLFDLAKLTLGAFIGSYVQRQVERRREEGEVPPGKTRSASSSLPT